MANPPSVLSFHANLEVSDLQASIAFFGPFGFVADVTMGDPPSFARLVKDGVSFTVNAVESPAVAGIVVIYFDVDDVEASAQICRDSGIDLVQPITTHPWGMRDFVLRGPDGHLFAFGQRLS